MADNSRNLDRGETPNVSNTFNVSVQTSEIFGEQISENALSVPTTLATAASTSKWKTPAFQITSITIGSRSSNDGGDDSADDLDESHTDDMSDVIDSKITDLENETPSFSEDTFSREDVFFNAASATSLCTAPVIPTSAQYGLAIVPSEAGASSVKNSSANNVTSPSSNEVQLTAVETVKPIVTCAKIIEPEVKDVQVVHPTRSERFKVVKIESTEPFKRGRWTCMDYLDQPTPHQPISQMQTRFLVRPSVPLDSTTPGCGRNPTETAGVPSDQGSALLQKTDAISNIKPNTTIQELNQPVIAKHQSSLTNIGSGQNSLANYPPTSCSQTSISQQHQPLYQLNTPTQSLPAQSVPQQQQTIQQSHQGVSVAQQHAMQQHSQNLSQIPNQQTNVSNQVSQQSQPTLLHHSLLPQQIQQVMASPNLPQMQQYQQSYLTHQQAQQQGMIIHQQIMQQPIPQQPLQQLHYQHQQMQHQPLPQMQLQFPQDLPTLQQTQMQQVYHQIPHNQMVGVQQQIPQQIQQQYYYSLPTSGSFQVPVTATQTLAGVHIISQPQVSLNAQTQPFTSTANHNITQQVQQQSYQQQYIQQMNQSMQVPPQTSTTLGVLTQQTVQQQMNQSMQVPPQTSTTLGVLTQQTVQQQMNQSMQVPPQTSTTLGVLTQQTVQQQMQHQPAQSHQAQAVIHQTLSQSHMTNFVHQNAQVVPQQTFMTQTSLKQPTMMQQGNLVQQQYLSQQQQTSNQPQQWNVASQQALQAPVSTQVILSPTMGVGLSSDVSIKSLSNSIPSTFGLQAVSENVTSQTTTSAISKPTSFSTGAVLKAPQPVMLAAKEEAQNETTTVQSVKLLETLAGAAQEMQTTVKNPVKANTTNAVAIDNKIEQAMDLVKTHLMYAVREEVIVLKEKIAELMERTSQLEYENNILRTGVNQETLDQLNSSILLTGQAVSNAAQPANNAAQPASNAAQPASNAAQPASNAAQPASNAAQPASNAAQPASYAAQQASNAGKM